TRSRRRAARSRSTPSSADERREARYCFTVGSSGAGWPDGVTVCRNSYSAPTSSGAMFLKASHGIGEPAYLRPPFLNRATNVARSGNFVSALPLSGVMFGGLKNRVRSTPGIVFGSIGGSPPENRGPTSAPVIGLNGEWQPPQLATD